MIMKAKIFHANHASHANPKFPEEFTHVADVAIDDDFNENEMLNESHRIARFFDTTLVGDVIQIGNKYFKIFCYKGKIQFLKSITCFDSFGEKRIRFFV